MEEVKEIPKVNMRDYAQMHLDQVVQALPRLPAADAEKIIYKREKDFGKNPSQLIALLNTAENFPELKSTIDKTKLIETKHLDAPQTFRLLTNSADEHLRELKNVATHRSLSLLKPSDRQYSLNPKRHENDSPEVLTQYLIDNPKSGFHFLRTPNFQQALTEKPVLIAQMIEADDDLRKTIAREETTRLPKLPRETKTALNTFHETVTTLYSEQMGNIPERDALRESAKSIAKTANLGELPIKAIEDLNTRTKAAVSNATASLLNKLPDTDEKKLLQEKLAGIQHAQQLPGQGPYGLNLYETAKKMITQHNAWQKIQTWLNDPALQKSERFNAIRPNLEKLNASSSISELGQHETLIDEISSKNTALQKIDKFMAELEKKSPETAEKFKADRAELNEHSQQRHLDEFARTLEGAAESKREQRVSSLSMPKKSWGKTENAPASTENKTEKKTVTVPKEQVKKLGQQPKAAPPRFGHSH